MTKRRYTVKVPRTDIFYVSVRAKSEEEAKEAAVEVFLFSDQPLDDFDWANEGVDPNDCEIHEIHSLDSAR